MKQLKIGKSGIEASVLGLGAWAIGGDSSWGPSDEAESVRTIHRARDLGITLVDTAPAYGLGHSEEVVGKALAGRRDKYILATKCGLRWEEGVEGAFHMERDGLRIVRNSKPQRIAEEVEASLKRLRTDYIDIYIVHWQAAPEFPVPVSETAEFLLKLKKEGKIRAIGASNASVQDFRDYVSAGALDLIQEKYSALDQGKGIDFFGLCEKERVTFQCYSPLERGILTGKYGLNTPVNMGLARQRIKWFEKENLPKVIGLAEKWKPLCEKYSCSMTHLVLAWTAAQGNGENVHVLVGARALAQIEENAGGGALSLEASDIALMGEDARALGI